MRVYQLIEHLQKFHQESEVLVVFQDFQGDVFVSDVAEVEGWTPEKIVKKCGLEMSDSKSPLVIINTIDGGD